MGVGGRVLGFAPKVFSWVFRGLNIGGRIPSHDNVGGDLAFFIALGGWGF